MVNERGDATGPTVEGRPPGTFDSLRIPDFRLVWFAGAATFLAVGISNTARGWLAVELTDSNTALGGVMGVFAIGMVAFTPIAGVAADRLDKRQLLLAVHVFFVAVTATIGALVLTERIEFWMLLLGSLANGAGFAFMGPVRIAIISEQVETSMIPNALALSQLTVSGTMVFGPALAGVLLSVDSVGISGAYLIAAALLGVAAVPVWFMTRRPKPDPTGRSPFRELADGFSYARSRPDLRTLVGFTLLVVFAAFSYTSFLPRVVESTFDLDAQWLGILLSFNAAGGLLAALAVARERDPARTRRWRLRAPFLAIVGLAGLAVSPSIWLVGLAVLVMGMAMTGFQTLSMSSALMLAEPSFHGRLQSLLMLSFSAAGVAAVLFGAIADLIGLREVFAVMACLAACVGVIAIRADQRNVLPAQRAQADPARDMVRR